MSVAYFWLIELHLVDEVIELHSLLLQLLRGMGPDITVVLVRPNDVEAPSFVAFQRLYIGDERTRRALILACISAASKRQRLGRKVTWCKGWNALCSQLPLEKNSEMFFGGTNLQEVTARSLASRNKITVAKAAKLVLLESRKGITRLTPPSIRATGEDPNGSTSGPTKPKRKKPHPLKPLSY